MTPHIIGVRGAFGSGKSTLVQILKTFGPDTELCFADALRTAVSELTRIPVAVTQTDEGKKIVLSELRPPLQWDPEEFLALLRKIIVQVTGDADIAKAHAPRFARVLADFAKPVRLKDGMTVGRLLQLMGTECFREIDPNVWVNALMRKWRTLGSPHVLIGDVRFPEEQAAIHKAGGVVIEIRRAGAMREDGRAASHASERALDGVKADYVIKNDGTLEDLKNAAAVMWMTIGSTSSSAAALLRSLSAF